MVHNEQFQIPEPLHWLPMANERALLQPTLHKDEHATENL